MKSNLICMLITIIAYLILMIVVGILASKKNKDTSDFYLGGSPMSDGQSLVWQLAHISTGYSLQNGCEFILSTTARLQFQTFSRTAITITNIS